MRGRVVVDLGGAFAAEDAVDEAPVDAGQADLGGDLAGGPGRAAVEDGERLLEHVRAGNRGGLGFRVHGRLLRGLPAASDG